MRFNDLVFDDGMLSVRRDDGSEQRLTRQERALLLHFINNAGKLLTRPRLIDVMARDAGETSERNIDFLVNRLRRTLGDDARRPRFIATQYGEGYVWIAQRIESAPRSAFLLLGPVYGLRAETGRERDVLAKLTATLDSQIGIGRKVSYAPDWRPSMEVPEGVAYSLDVSFHAEAATLHTALMLRHALSRHVIGAFRARFDNGNAAGAIDRLAAEVKAAIWAHLAIPVSTVAASSDTPLEVRLYDAADMLSRTPEIWRENEAQLMRARVERPDDPTLAIMWGLNLYARLLSQALDSGEMMSSDEWSAIEDEMEALALASLPKVQDNPLLVLAVAKLLFFIDRGHSELAAQLADEAFANSTAFAAAFALQGQIRMCRGDIADAVGFYDKGIEMSEPGSAFHRYLLVLKCTALLAANQRPALDRVCAELYAVKPVTRQELGLLVADPKAHKLPPDIEAVLLMLTGERARKLMAYFYNVFARRFHSRDHRRNVMRGLVTHTVRHFGRGVVPEPVSRTFGWREGRRSRADDRR
jgi:DNA-binding winged helix-turn-helix (wHTH) protein